MYMCMCMCVHVCVYMYVLVNTIIMFSYDMLSSNLIDSDN